MRKPNFFLVGGAKCGTTSVAQWLAEHPEIYMSPVKEPDYFYPGGMTTTLEAYEELFSDAGPHHVAVGEASVRYLSSVTAIRSADAYAGPEARFVVIVRNPIDMAESLHAQRLYSASEDIADFEKAWRMQSARRQAGFRWPRDWYTPEVNLYGEVCRLGSQCRRLVELVGRERVLILTLDDIKADPGAEWVRLQQFLGVREDGREQFYSVNERKSIRSHFTYRLLIRVAAMKRQVLGERSLGVARLVNRFNVSPAGPGSTMSPAFREELRAYFDEEIALLSELTGKDLSNWR
jgi:hypothetical protein